ncbi:MAG TPA: phosphotransferase, partial [Pyrinomonadaceae bacterium]|nr:phosphotransferase [Pyrinomonadaceae bacterium]
LYRIRIGSSEFNVAARVFHKGRSEQAYRRAIDKAVACQPLRPVVHDAELETVFWTFPNDRKLAGLHALVNIPAELGRAFVPAWTQSRMVGYAPEKCATAQCLDDRLQVLAYAKLYAGSDGRRIAGVYQALRQQQPPASKSFVLPRLLSYRETYRMLLLEAVEGERIADLTGTDMRRGYELLGGALAELHNLPVPESLPPFRRLDVERMRNVARIIGQARPDVQREAVGLAADLAALWKPQDEPPVCVHGDVHPKNGILRGDRLTLIDLDQAGLGHPAADLGSLLAGLSYNRLSGLVSRSVALELGDSFLAGYERVRRLPQASSLSWHTAAALLGERALRAVNRIRPEGLERLRELLVEAHHILHSGGLR